MLLKPKNGRKITKDPEERYPVLEYNLIKNGATSTYIFVRPMECVKVSEQTPLLVFSPKGIGMHRFAEEHKCIVISLHAHCLTRCQGSGNDVNHEW
jgi:hypothetical protein